ncbi:class F sortase [Kitasatospora sp. MBT63]|uniref:class F sortase n=1 Tax=Kitasatospora sp. MBT63 TaxID=1444768 RepID=UPI0009EA1AC4|nr:class F sortase [Kitasatospora sp. MBT63]
MTAATVALVVGLALAGAGTLSLATSRGRTGPAAVQDIGDIPGDIPGERSEAAGPRAPVGPAAPPVRIRIPRIRVDSGLTDLQVQGDGHLGTPDDPQVAGWWSQGPAPGSPGTAVIVGHVDSLTGPAVFAGLSVLRPGDAITVDAADGTTSSFTVQALRSYDKDDFPDDLIFGNTPDPGLHLITCGGTYDRASQEYLSNLVVFAIPAGRTTGTTPA